jgi:hypothetical protein
MAFIDTNTAIFFLKYNSLEVYSLRNAPPQKLIFPAVCLQNQEIIDRIVFEKTLKTFLSQLKTNEAVIILSNQILFGGMFSSDTLEKQESTIKNFFAQIPFDEDKIAKKVVFSKSLLCIATNKEYYNTVKFIAEQANIKIKAVLPAGLFTQQEQNFSELINNILKQPELAEQSNFLIPNKQEHLFLDNKEENTPTTIARRNAPSKAQYIILTICLIVIISAITFAIIQQNKTNKSPQNPGLNNVTPVQQNSIPTSTPIILPSPSTASISAPVQ